MKELQTIPQTDPLAGYVEHKDEIDAAIARVLGNGRYILGPETELFEQEFAAFTGTSDAVGVANGTEALQLALLACGIGHGDFVFTVSHTAVATIAAIELTGAIPVFIDIDAHTFTICPGSLEDAVRIMTKTNPGRCKAVIPVHLYGHPAAMRDILRIAESHGLRVIEDCAQSHGACLEGKMTGCWGDIAAFSFYPTKNLGAFGDGGAVVTNDAALAERVRQLRQYGWKTRFISESTGMNSRLDEVQSALLRVKLEYLEHDNSRRRDIAAKYDRGISHPALMKPQVEEGIKHVWHQYVVRSDQRDALKQYLAAQGIGTAVHYPQPVHLQPAYRHRIREIVPLSQTEIIGAQILSLPMYPQLNDDDVERIITAVNVGTF